MGLRRVAKSRVLLPILAVFVLWFGCPVTLAQDDSAAPDSDYVIGVEDVLDVAIWKEPEISRRGVIVRPDGKIGVPLVGDITADGKTPRRLAAELKETLVRYIKDPVVTVIVEQVNSFKVYMLGSVGNQGALPLKRRTRLLEALAQAGGLTEFANKRIVIVRWEAGREKRIVIDYRKLVGGERPGLNVFLRPGDTIIVE
jgi:polysaccharide export outer membrane protein